MADSSAGGTGWPDKAVHEAQAAAEGVTLTGTVTFRGRDYKLGNLSPGFAAYANLASASARGVGTLDDDGLAAMRDVLRDLFIVTPGCGDCDLCDAGRDDQCEHIDEGDWPAFWRRVRIVRADPEEIFSVMQQAMEQATARPTGPPPGSSAGGPPRSASSRGSSSSLATPPDRLPEAFRGERLVAVDDLLRSRG